LSESQPKNRFTVNIALISIFSALWVALNLTVAPLSFALLGLPVVHSLIIFFMLILVVWATGQFGAASAVGTIGSVITVLAGGPLPVLGFIPAAILFDVILLVNHHRVNLKPVSVGVVVLASVVCAFVAAVTNGFLILSLEPAFIFTVWAGWNILGAVVGAAIVLPIVGALDRAQVKRVKVE
jgi:hypothetical protein